MIIDLFFGRDNSDVVLNPRERKLAFNIYLNYSQENISM